MRNYLDPKKFYKSSDSFSPFAQRGTYVGSGAELSKRAKKGNLLDEVMSDAKTRRYIKRKFGEVQEKSQR